MSLLATWTDILWKPGVLPVAGTLASALIAAAVSAFQARRTVENLRIEVLERYSTSLYAKRLEVYPDLYFILSELGKIRADRSVTNKDVLDTLAALNAWDSKNAIYVSATTIRLLLDVRDVFARCREFPEGSVLDEKLEAQVFYEALRLEQGLKEELGVYEVTGFNKPKRYVGALDSALPRGGSDAR